MNNLTLTEEQAMLLETVRRFVADEVAPAAHATDRGASYPLDPMRKLAGLGLLSLPIPEALGGAGMGWLAQGLCCLELAKGCGSTAMAVLGHVSLTAAFLATHCDDEQRKRWVPALCAGERIGAFALDEPVEGSDPATCAATAKRSGDGSSLSGEKSFVAGATAADLFVVPARAEGGGVSAFVLEKGTPGLEVVPEEDPLGLRGAGFGTLRLSDCRVAARDRVGEEGRALPALAWAVDRARVSLACLCVGLCERAIELSRVYAGQRIAFGKPLSAQQAVALKLAEMTFRSDAARHLAFHACRCLDEGDEDVRVAAANAKAAAAEAATFCGDEGIQIHGGYGYVAEYVVERIYRDAKVCEVAAGSGEVCRLAAAERILAR